MQDISCFLRGDTSPRSSLKVIELPSYVARTRILLTIGILVLFAGFIVSFASDDVSAAGLTRVQGNVYAPSGNPAVNADVVVEFLNKDTGDPRTWTWTGTTDGNGYYQTTNLGPSDWEVGDTVKVTLTYNSDTKIATKVSVNEVVQVVDYHYPTEIPQLGGLLGSLIAMGTVATVAVVFIQKKDRKAN